MGLRQFRIDNGLTQEQLGNYIGIKKSYISKIENGKEKLRGEKLQMLLNNDLGWDTSSLLINAAENTRIDELQKEIEKLKKEREVLWTIITKLTKQ